jgi:hypothetical protein
MIAGFLRSWLAGSAFWSKGPKVRNPIGGHLLLTNHWGSMLPESLGMRKACLLPNKLGNKHATL